MHLSFQKLFFVIFSIIAIFGVMILAKAILIPLSFSLLTAFILYPLCQRFESWGVNKILSVILAMLALFLILGGGVVLFSSQIVQLTENVTEFKGKILQVFAEVTLFINKNVPFIPRLERGELLEKLTTWLNDSTGTLVNQTFSGTINFLTGFLSSIVFTFLILLYRNGLVHAFANFYEETHRERAFQMFKSVHKVGKNYLLGMMLIVLILGVVNSVGLWIIGIDNPFLFGFLAAVLAIIPYVGTLTGAAIPIIYAVINYDVLWMPIAITIYFWLVQVIESNFLTPTIVGGKLQVNALTAILSIIIGASVWGIAGMILFLPFASMLKVICEHYAELKPVALLIGDQNYIEEDEDSSTSHPWLVKIKGWFSSE